MCPLDYLAHGPLRDFCPDHLPSPSTQEGRRHAEYWNRLKPSTGSKHPLCKGLDSSPPFPKLHLFWEQGRKESEKPRNSRLGQKLVRLRLGKRTASFGRALPWQYGQLLWLQAAGTGKKYSLGISLPPLPWSFSMGTWSCRHSFHNQLPPRCS